MADSTLPLNNLAPVKNRFPILAEVKSKVDVGGLDLLRISKLISKKKDRISSLLAEEMAAHKEDVPDTISCHCAAASVPEVDESRWLNRVTMAVLSGEAGWVGISRTSRLRTSPMPGPPNTLMSSEEDPPLSLMGMI